MRYDNVTTTGMTVGNNTTWDIAEGHYKPLITQANTRAYALIKAIMEISVDDDLIIKKAEEDGQVEIQNWFQKQNNEDIERVAKILAGFSLQEQNIMRDLLS